VTEKKELKIWPTPGHLLIQEDGARKLEGKIIVPEKFQKRPTTGKVVAIGEGVTIASVGKRVLFNQYSGTGIKFKGLPWYRSLVPDEVIAVIEGEGELEDVSA
jgi:co-chaperonin GroES (HSP10)